MEEHVLAYSLWHALAEVFFYMYWGEFLLKLFGLGVGGAPHARGVWHVWWHVA